MPNIKSQKKRVLTNEKAQQRNKAVKSELKTAVRRSRRCRCRRHGRCQRSRHRSLAPSRQGCQQGRHPQEHGSEPQVHDHGAGQPLRRLAADGQHPSLQGEPGIPARFHFCICFRRCPKNHAQLSLREPLGLLRQPPYLPVGSPQSPRNRPDRTLSAIDECSRGYELPDARHRTRVDGVGRLPFSEQGRQQSHGGPGIAGTERVEKVPYRRRGGGRHDLLHLGTSSVASSPVNATTFSTSVDRRSKSYPTARTRTSAACPGGRLP